MPQSIWVTLENDLVDSCKPGDDVMIWYFMLLDSTGFELYQTHFANRVIKIFISLEHFKKIFFVCVQWYSVSALEEAASGQAMRCTTFNQCK